MHPAILPKDLSTLLWQTINDRAVYHSLVPWILNAHPEAPTLSAYVQQRQLLQDYQLQAPHAMPQDMRQCVLQAVERCCNNACSLCADACPTSRPAAVSAPGGSKHSAIQQDQTAIGNCCLQESAVQLAKLHGHLLANGLVPNLADHLHLLVLLLTSGPLQPSTNRTASSSSQSQSNNHSRDRKRQSTRLLHDGTAAVAAAGPCSEAICSAAGPEQLLSCRTCAAHYAAKALVGCSKVLCCMPQDVADALLGSPHVQHYAPTLFTLLFKSANSSKSAAVISRNSTVVGSSSHPQENGQQQQTLCTPAAAMAASVCAENVQTVVASGGLGSSSAPWSAGLGGRPSTGGGGGKLSGLGLLVHSAPGSAGGRSTGGQGPAGKTSSAAVCNREKSRDLFFSILRRCSSRLEALRQQQAAAADLQEPQQQAAAAVVFNTELQELMADVGLAAKQLLLQLAPVNQVYLAELFTACVLQAASTGEPILEPQLALMAERDPGKFHKLQQRLADRTGGAGSPGLPPAAGEAATQAEGLSSRSRSAGSANRPTATGAWPSNAKSSAQSVTPQLVPLAQQQPRHHHPDREVQLQQQQQKGNGVGGGGQSHKVRSRPVVQGLAATGLMCRTPANSSSSTGGVTGRPLPTAPRQIKPTPSSAGGSTGNSFRLAAAAGLNTPMPFGAGGSAAGASPGASPLLPSSGTGVLAQGTSAVVGANDLTPVSQQQAGSSISKGRGVLDTSVSCVVQLDANMINRADAVSELFASGSAATGAVHQTPASAPAGPPGAAALPVVAAPGSAPLKAPSTTSHPAAAIQPQAGSTTVLQQLLAEMPAGQHVLLLVLHAADSSSFNRSLLDVMLGRTEQLLSSGPASLSAAGGLGQQASAVVALGKYSSYLSFVAGATQVALSGSAAAFSTSQLQKTRGNNEQNKPPLLQQQPAVDVSNLLAYIADSSRSDTCLDPGWCVALAVPFICSYLQFIRFNPSAASSASVCRVTTQLRSLQALPCMSAKHPMYGSLSPCISCCLQHCECLQQAKDPNLQALAAPAVSEGQDGAQAQQMRQQSMPVVELPAFAEWWCQILQEGSQYVDNAYWAVCCPGLQQLSSLLATSVTAAHRQQQQQNQQQRGTPQTSERLSRASASRPAEEATRSSPSAVQPPAAAASATTAQEQQAATSDAGTAAAAEHGSTSPAGSVTSLRHTTPLLLAPREPPALDKPPAAITAALAEANDPLRQQLQQAFLGQYSTDDNPVKMRDVLALVNGILCANSLSLGLCQGVPPVLQQHLDTLSQEVQEQLGPVGAPRRLPLQGQDLARAVHSICNQHSAPAIHAALESAMQKASEHACQAATAACAALLPADVPPAATAAAAALVAASCKASCAQRLLQEVPVLVQSSLADQADELVKLVTRQWAVHTRITAPTAAAAESPSNTEMPSSSSRRLKPVVMQSQTASRLPYGVAAASSTGVDKAAQTAPRRINPVPVDDAGIDTKEEVVHSNADSTGIVAGTSRSNNTDHAAVAPSQHKQPGISDSSSSTEPASCGASAVAAVPGAAVPAPAATTAQDLLLDCSSPKSRQKSCRVCATDAEPVIDSMLQQVAAALAQPSLCGALQDYLAAVTKLLPESSSRVVVGTVAEYSGNRQQQQPIKHHNPWCAVVRAAAHTAELLIAGVTAGVYSLPALEQQLVLCIDPSGNLKPHQPAGNAIAVGLRSDDKAGCTGDSKLQVDAVSRPPAEMQGTLYQLLAGAVVHAFLTSSQQKARMWSGGEAQYPGYLEESSSSQHFVMLPAILMKAARMDKPAWLLKQLRCWIQDTTLGY